MQEVVGSHKGNLRRVGVGCQRGFWTNPERSSACSSCVDMEMVWQMMGGAKTSRGDPEKAEEKGGTSEEWHQLLDSRAAFPSPKALFLSGSWGRRVGLELQQ